MEFALLAFGALLALIGAFMGLIGNYFLQERQLEKQEKQLDKQREYELLNRRVDRISIVSERVIKIHENLRKLSLSFDVANFKLYGEEDYILYGYIVAPEKFNLVCMLENEIFDSEQYLVPGTRKEFLRLSNYLMLVKAIKNKKITEEMDAPDKCIILTEISAQMELDIPEIQSNIRASVEHFFIQFFETGEMNIAKDLSQGDQNELTNWVNDSHLAKHFVFEYKGSMIAGERDAEIEPQQ